MVWDARKAGGRCTLEFGVVAADASGRQRAAVVSTHMARGARCRYVRAKQWESGRIMIEC